MKRILSFVLAVCLVIGLFPTGLFSTTASALDWWDEEYCEGTYDNKHRYKDGCEDTTCDYCDYVRGIVVGHTYTDCEDATCNYCGYTRNAPGHYKSYCTDRTCRWCDEFVGARSHRYTDCLDTDCDECTFSRTAPGHKYTNCADATCNNCTFVRTASEDQYTDCVDIDCEVCGYIRTPPGHSYSDCFDLSCNNCDYSRPASHNFTLNDGYTCGECKYSKTPEAPELISYDNGITLKAYEGFEYSEDGINWQDSNVFADSQSKTFYQRVKASDIAQESASSSAMILCKVDFNGNGGSGTPESIYFAKDTEIQLPTEIPTKSRFMFAGWNTMEYTTSFAPGETVAFSGDIQLYAMWDDGCSTCDHSGRIVHVCGKCRGYGYYFEVYYLACYTNGCPGNRENTTPIKYGDGSRGGFECSTCHWPQSYTLSTYENKVSCAYKCEDGKYYTTCDTCSGLGRLLQAAPTVISYNHSSVTLLAKTGYEYSFDGRTWQTSPIFTGLEPNSIYTFYQRQAATETTPFGTTSAGKTVTTDRRNESAIPEPPTLNSRTATSITLNSVEGCEYSNDGTNWQWSNAFSDLNCATEYTFYQRYAQTDTAYAGESSAGEIFKTDKGTQSKPFDPTLSSKTYNSVTLYYMSGYEYSCDAINWQSSNVFTGLAPETNYLFYQRKAETDTYYVSEASEPLIVKTAEAPACILDPTRHSFSNYISDNNATCLADGTETAKCDRCEVTDTRTDVDSKLGHSFTSYVSNNNATYEADGTKTAKCDRCEATDTIIDIGSQLARNGWVLNSGKWYYYKNNVKLTGWVKDGGCWYYMNGNGVMQTGWLKYGNVWYYLKSGGNMATAWCKVGSVYYYMNKDGIMQTGWIKDGGVWYYMNSSGAMVTGWQKVGTVWYYFKSSGAMQTGWLKLGSTWYYFNSSGAMATGSVKIGSKTYNFNASGACLNP